MRLLITNSREEQSYLILRSLRHEAERIVVTVDEGNLFRRWFNSPAWSRYVSKRYTAPDCTADWRAGRIEPDNTPAEERYIRRIEEICEREDIDVIFPSYDAEVFVFSKNKERLARRGALAVVPDYQPLTRVLDKSLTLEAARKVGFPIPATRVPQGPDELRRAAEEIPAPWVLKPRCNAHGANILMVDHLEELEQAFTALNEIQPRPMVQEYVPARTKRNYYLVVGSDGEIASLLSPRVDRYRRVGVESHCAAVESTREVPCEAEVRALVRELGVWGALTLQTIVDERDGAPKLMEINPRFGHNTWYQTELGINAPLVALRLARGQEPGPIPAVPEGYLLLDPLWDLLHLLGQSLDQSANWLRGRLRGGSSTAAGPYRPDAVPDMLRAFRAEYFGPRKRITNPLNRGLLSDPLPALVRTVRTLVKAVMRRIR
ncbi:MAG: ATP-grasp domain-containing protein [Lysobacterales bacterium]